MSDPFFARNRGFGGLGGMGMGGMGPGMGMGGLGGMTGFGGLGGMTGMGGLGGMGGFGGMFDDWDWGVDEGPTMMDITYDPFFDTPSIFVEAFPTDVGPAPRRRQAPAPAGGGQTGRKAPIKRHMEPRLDTTAEGDEIWRPSTDVYETPEAVLLHVDLPGVPRDEIGIELHQNNLIVEGTHKGAAAGYESATARVRERNVGKFRKSVRIPKGMDVDKIETKYENGLLEIKIPKSESEKRKRIPLTTQQDTQQPPTSIDTTKIHPASATQQPQQPTTDTTDASKVHPASAMWDAAASSSQGGGAPPSQGMWEKDAEGVHSEDVPVSTGQEAHDDEEMQEGEKMQTE